MINSTTANNSDDKRQIDLHVLWKLNMESISQQASTQQHAANIIHNEFKIRKAKHVRNKGCTFAPAWVFCVRMYVYVCMCAYMYAYVVCGCSLLTYVIGEFRPRCSRLTGCVQSCQMHRQSQLAMVFWVLTRCR